MPRDLRASDVIKDEELLNRLGYGILDVQARDNVGFEDVRRYSYLVEPEQNPRAIAHRLRQILGRPFTEAEARAAWQDILRYKLDRLKDNDEDISMEQAAREWDAEYGFGFRRRWYLTRKEPVQRKYLPGGHERGPGPLGRTAGVIMPELKPLLEAGFSVNDILLIAARNPLRTARIVLHRVPRRDRDKYYVRLVADMTGWELSQEEAERVWVEALKHKLYVKEKFDQDISMERAVVDYVKRLRLSGLDRVALWETGQIFASNTPDYSQDRDDVPSSKPGALFPD